MQPIFSNGGRRALSIVPQRPAHSPALQRFDMPEGEWYEKDQHIDACLFSEHSSHGALMTATAPSHTWPSFSPLLFARNHDDLDFDDDLDFNDDLDDFGNPRKKPPRRWFTFILIILLAGGTWYVMTEPSLQSSVMQMVNTVRVAFGSLAEDPVPQPEPEVRPPTPEVPPVPAFHEGQRVAVAPHEGRQARFRLRNEAEGEQLGPVVKTGDALTVLDGSLIKKRWVYFVQTYSGDSGWIKDTYLKPLP